MQILDRPSLFNRSDTMFGVCQGLGDDLRIHPDILRLSFAVFMFFYPLAALGGYAGAGMLVLATRLMFPVPVAAAGAQPEASPAPAAEPAEEQEELPLAA